MDGLRCRESPMFGITGDWSTAAIFRPWGLVQHSLQRGLQVDHRVREEERGKGLRKPTEEDSGRSGGQS